MSLTPPARYADVVSKIAHLSASSLMDFLTCPSMWAGRRLYDLTERKTSALEVGSAIHRGLAAHHLGEDAELALLTYWQEHVAPTKPVASLFGYAIAVLNLYCDQVERHELDSCEMLFRATIPDVPVPLIGYLDLLRSPTPEADEIHEFKTGTSIWTQERVDQQLQATCYLWAYRAETGTLPREFRYHWLKLSPPVGITTFVTTRTDEQLDAFVTLAQQAWAEMAAGEPYGATCPPGRCRFPEHCPGREAEREQPGEMLTAPALVGAV